MSTRSVIARKDGLGFKGVYHHWDGYPSGLGATLFEVRNKFYQGDTKRMLQYLIDANPGGWSTINKDWSLAPSRNRAHDNDLLCEECGKAKWMHYRQYYKPSYSPQLSEWERAGRPTAPPGDEIACLGHQFKGEAPETGPEPNGGKDGLVTDASAGGCGCEWAYVFDGNGTMEIQCSYCNGGAHDGVKMIGMFGLGDPNSIWKTVAVVNLDGEEPDWKRIEKRV